MVHDQAVSTFLPIGFVEPDKKKRLGIKVDLDLPHIALISVYKDKYGL